MVPSSECMSIFDPVIQRWFTENLGRPTDIQEQAWPLISKGEHLLMTAPTGSGKTLTAFLWALNQLFTEKWESGKTSVLYVSPLKALNNDIRKNLFQPLRELRLYFQEEERTVGNVHVVTRSGDTPQSERRKMLRRPPEIFITTPESLHIMLTSKSGQSIFHSIKTVIIDEIHSIVGTKRGVLLISSIERLVRLSGEFQRLALSATIRPLERVAQFIGGFQANAEGTDFQPRHIAITSSKSQKIYDIGIRCPQDAIERESGEPIWTPLAKSFKDIVLQNRSTLIFTNSRRLCEKLTLKINHNEVFPIAYAHHGSLSRDIRHEVEHKLKHGQLRAIVATNSLEMGIDIGSLDEVIMLQCPKSLSSAIQRIGRAGHHVGEVSRGRIFPTHSHDFLEAAIVSKAVLEQSIEPVKPILNALDVLAQLIISLTAQETWLLDELYHFILSIYSFHTLPRHHFDMVIAMLSGKYARTRIRELNSRIMLDPIEQTIRAKKIAVLDLYMSGGVIPDRGYYNLKDKDTNSRIGELDEEFVWEAKIGQTFTLGTQHWRIEQITQSDVVVSPSKPSAKDAPFWKAEGINRDFYFSEKIGLLLEEVEQLEHLNNEEGFLRLLRDEHQMDEISAQQLHHYLQLQREHLDCPLPHRHHLVIEVVLSGPGAAPGNQVVLHTFWGGQVNRPYGIALQAAWENEFGHSIEVYPGDDCIVIILPQELSGDELLSLVSSEKIDALLHQKLQSTGFFGAHFRENAGRALLLGRSRINQRMPLWMTRLKAQKLLAAVNNFDDFPILFESWRSCLQDEFDMNHLRQVLLEIEAGEIQWTMVHTATPSPMARAVTWRQINDYMYRDDAAKKDLPSKISTDLLQEAMFHEGLRPTVPRHIVHLFEEKRQRLFAGYTPQTAEDLLEWLKERVLLAESEWKLLQEAVKRDCRDNNTSQLIFDEINKKVVWISEADLAEKIVCAIDALPELLKVLYQDRKQKYSIIADMPAKDQKWLKEQIALLDEDDQEQDILIVSEWLQFFGPLTGKFIKERFGFSEQRIELVITSLLETKTIVEGKLLTDDDSIYICDTSNFQNLLKLARRERQPDFQPVNAEKLPLFLAHFHHIGTRNHDIDGFIDAMEQLLCLPQPAEYWEKDILPARFQNYEPLWLDSLFREDDFIWSGAQKQQIYFCFKHDRELMESDRNIQEISEGTENIPSPDKNAKNDIENPLYQFMTNTFARYNIVELFRMTEFDTKKLYSTLWQSVWAGEISADSFEPLRRGMEQKFRLPSASIESLSYSPYHRRGFNSRQTRNTYVQRTPLVGNWFRLHSTEKQPGFVAREERKKERVRILLDRYGIVFRELLLKESPEFSWPALFKTLRLMELSGEILTGMFFRDIPAPQFITPRAFRLLQRTLPDDLIYWIAAIDPLSLCGSGLKTFRGKLPKRLKNNYLVYRGEEIVVQLRRGGKETDFSIESDDGDIDKFLDVFHHLLTRRWQPEHKIIIEKINGEEAASSKYADVFIDAFSMRRDFTRIIISMKH